jgi:poly-gamma-glutamate synthesis protein (capsule biosynthesis protein)
LGNNHINDFGVEGIIETMEILRDNKINFFGAGRNIKEANKEVIIERNGLKLSFLGYTTDEKHVKSIIAGEDTAGCVFCDFKKIKEDIERVKAESDIICISLHWGYEYYLYPSPEQIELAHQIIDAGAHIVIGHHPHIIQGFERYKHGIIFYSLGNFFFPNLYDKSGYLHKWREESNKSIIAKFEINKVNNKVNIGEVGIFPAFMNEDYRVIVLDGRDKEKTIPIIEEISKGINRNDYKSFLSDYHKKREQELSKIELEIGVPRLLQRIKELGVSGCIGKVSMRNIKSVGGMLIRYLNFRFNKSLSNLKLKRRDV